MDKMKRAFSYERLTDSYALVPSGADAGKLEQVAKAGGMATGRPLLNPG